jgi:hypothetical protein
MQPIDPMIHYGNINKREELEKKGYIFEINAYFCSVHFKEQVVIDHEQKYSRCLRQCERDNAYQVHLNMAIEAIKKFESLDIH